MHWGLQREELQKQLRLNRFRKTTAPKHVFRQIQTDRGNFVHARLFCG
jgi:hypothetical protein